MTLEGLAIPVVKVDIPAAVDGATCDLLTLGGLIDLHEDRRWVHPHAGHRCGVALAQPRSHQVHQQLGPELRPPAVGPTDECR